MSDVESLFEECLARPESEWAAALDRLCRDHPEHADELRERFALLGAVGLTSAISADAMPERLGDFRLLQRLGEGGMGVVYVARQESLGRDIALKIIRPDHLFFSGSRERFRREIDAVARLNHPGIVKVHAAGEEGGVPYLAMELVEGCTFAEALAELTTTRPTSGRPRDGATLRDAVLRATGRKLGRKLDVDLRGAESATLQGSWVDCCVRIVRELAVALDHAHQRGVLHRDVKPSNVLVDTSGRVLLLDFGLASAEGSERLTKSGSNLGSLAYMPPEQLRGEPVDARADVYALGATLFELLTLQLPFVGADAAELRARILVGDPVAPSRIAAGIPWDVETVCLVALERDPARRYATAAAFAADLGRLLAHEPIAARRAGAALRARRWVQRRPTLAVGLALGFLLFVVGPTVGFFVVKGERDKLELANQRIKVEARTAERTAGFMHDLFLSSDPYDQNDPDLKVRTVLEGAAKRLETELEELPEVRARLLHDLGDAYLGLALPEPALPLLERAEQMATELHGEASFQRAEVLQELGQAQRMLGNLDAATKALERAAAIAAPLPSVPADWRLRLEAVRGNLADDRLQFGVAIEHYERALAIARTIVPPSEWVPRVRLNLSTSLLNAKRIDDAHRELTAAQDEIRLLRPGGSLNEVEIETNLAWIDFAAGRFRESQRQFEHALTLAQRLVGTTHPVVATLVNNLGGIYMQRREWPRAIELLQASLDAIVARGGGTTTDALEVRINLIEATSRGGRRDLAEPVARDLIAEVKDRPASAHNLAHARIRLASCFTRDGDVEQAATMLNAVELTSRVFERTVPFIRVDLLIELAHVARARGQGEVSIQWLEQAVAITKRGLAGHELIGSDAEFELGTQLHALGRDDRAEPLLLEAAKTRLAALGSEHSDTRAAIEALVDFFRSKGDDEHADEWQDKLPTTQESSTPSGAESHK